MAGSSNQNQMTASREVESSFELPPSLNRSQGEKGGAWVCMHGGVVRAPRNR